MHRADCANCRSPAGVARRTATLTSGYCLIALALVVLGGCVSVTRQHPDGSRERLRGKQIAPFAEEVFRRQNSASSRLMHLLPVLETGDPEAYNQLASAELEMLVACAPLNELAVRRRDGETGSMPGRQRLPRAIEACDRSTLTLEALLEAIPVHEGGAESG